MNSIMSETTAPELYNLDKINVHFLNPSSKTLPLVISPRFDDSLEFISTWLTENRPWVHNQMLQYGAVLIRGFQIDSAVDFEKATLALDPNLCDKYRGTSPRSLHNGTKFTFSAADVPVNYPIAQHIEMSFLKAPPRNIYFGCLKESKSEGGETALCDFRKVYKDLSPELRDKFISKKIKYRRKHYSVGEKWTYDVGAMKTWSELFGASTKKEVEDICKEENAPGVQWIGPNNDIFLQEWIDDPCQTHPISNELVWFNHSQVFHWTAFPAELWFAFLRIKSLPLFVHFMMISFFTFVKYGILGYKMSLDITFGDNSPITLLEMNEVRRAIHENMVFSRWSKGDILCIDNFSTSHGRQPTFDKGRKVIVAWSHPCDKTSSPGSSTNVVSADIAKKSTITTNQDTTKMIHTCPPLASITPETSPESSPESSMTKQEAEVLKQSLQEQRELAEKLQDYITVQQRKEETRVFHMRHKSCPNMFVTDAEFWRSAHEEKNQ